MKKHFYLTCFYMICVLVFVGCKSSSSLNVDSNHKKVKNQTDKRLATNWILTWMESTKMDTANFAKGLPNLELNVADSTASGSTGCNRLNAKLSTNTTGLFKLEWLSTTRMYCLDSVEPEYLERLTRINAYKLEKNILTLFENETPLLIYIKISE